MTILQHLRFCKAGNKLGSKKNAMKNHTEDLPVFHPKHIQGFPQNELWNPFVIDAGILWEPSCVPCVEQVSFFDPRPLPQQKCESSWGTQIYPWQGSLDPVKAACVGQLFFKWKEPPSGPKVWSRDQMGQVFNSWKKNLMFSTFWVDGRCPGDSSNQFAPHLLLPTYSECPPSFSLAISDDCVGTVLFPKGHPVSFWPTRLCGALDEDIADKHTTGSVEGCCGQGSAKPKGAALSQHLSREAFPKNIAEHIYPASQRMGWIERWKGRCGKFWYPTVRFLPANSSKGEIFKSNFSFSPSKTTRFFPTLPTHSGSGG